MRLKLEKLKCVIFQCSCEPVYEFPPPKYSAEGVIRILLNPDLDKSKVCTIRPTVVSISSTFVVDISKLAHPDDVKNDNFGIWSHSGSHPQAFRVTFDAADNFMQIEKCVAGVTGSDVVYLRRLHRFHPSNKGFKRMIAFSSGMFYLEVEASGSNMGQVWVIMPWVIF